jgi:hypothetical protein
VRKLGVTGSTDKHGARGAQGQQTLEIALVPHFLGLASRATVLLVQALELFLWRLAQYLYPDAVFALDPLARSPLPFFLRSLSVKTLPPLKCARCCRSLPPWQTALLNIRNRTSTPSPTSHRCPRIAQLFIMHGDELNIVGLHHSKPRTQWPCVDYLNKFEFAMY